ncbi:MAG: DNA alkylation repair protein [Blastocatellales bacterium]
MNLNEVMKQLESCGTEQNRKTWGRHGIKGEMFGVSFANLYKFQKQIKVNHVLAEQLWATGNHDAQVLATLIADPNAMTDKRFEEWAKELSNNGITLMFSKLLIRSPLARKKAEKWHKSKEELIASLGWTLISGLALGDNDLPDEYFEQYLKLIESGIHKQKNWVRYEMNGSLISIGLRNDRLEKKATEIAQKIGKVVVDHGDTNCKTPDAVEYIAKTKAYRNKKKAKAAAK